MRSAFLPSLFCLVVALSPPTLAGTLQSGPMVGYGEMKEAMLWVQTAGPAAVEAIYWPKARPDERHHTARITTQKQDAYVAKLLADEVEPGSSYSYQIEIDGKAVALPYAAEFKTPPQWKFRGEAPDFAFALGSCTYINEPAYDRPGKAYGADYRIFNSILAEQPDLMLWLGDNFYLREPDWNSWTGIVHRYTHGRSVPELQPLLASVHHYAILDDHDYGPNDSDRGFWNKTASLRAFELFWANPSAGIGDLTGAITFFAWSDVDFFLLDDRSHRTPNKARTLEKTILGREQLQWLKDALVHSDASFKVVALGGQFLNDAPVFETYANHGFDRERQEILDFIRDEAIRNVVFVTGDRHHTELSVLEKEGRPRVVDLTVSPLTAGPAGNNAAEDNTYREPGTLVAQRNFGIIRFRGPAKERRMEITIRDSDGRELWTRTIVRQP